MQLLLQRHVVVQIAYIYRVRKDTCMVILKMGLETSVLVANSLLDMYEKSGCFYKEDTDSLHMIANMGVEELKHIEPQEVEVKTLAPPPRKKGKSSMQLTSLDCLMRQFCN